MNGSVLYDGNTLLSGAINVNTGGNIELLNVSVTENGTQTINAPVGVDGYNPITIETNVPSVEPILDDITITENGTYTPPTGVDGYDEITVNVSQDVDIQPLTRTITTNGTTVINASDINVDGFNPVTITTVVDGYTIKTLANTPTPIASFTDGTSNPLKSLTTSIVPVQDLHGYDSPWVGGAGKNKFTIPNYSGSTYSGVSYSFNSDTNTLSKNGTSTGSGGTNVGEITVANGTYTFSAIFNETGSATYIYLRNKDTSENVIYISAYYPSQTVALDGTYYIRISTSTGATGGAISNIQLELGNSRTSFAPYSNICPISGHSSEVVTVADDVDNPTVEHTYTIPFTDGQGQSVKVFGGDIDVINGVVTPCPYYASYNGEQLTGEWLSDRDVYSPNTTPTIGAQVVNIGATGTSFSIQPTSIKSLDGDNNVFASTGDVEELKYFADI